MKKNPFWCPGPWELLWAFFLCHDIILHTLVLNHKIQLLVFCFIGWFTLVSIGFLINLPKILAPGFFFNFVNLFNFNDSASFLTILLNTEGVSTYIVQQVGVRAGNKKTFPCTTDSSKNVITIAQYLFQSLHFLLCN